ncbi:MAG: ATP-binding protein [Anaeromyxobacteraceae bacterium]
MESGEHGCRFVARLSLLSKVGDLVGTLDYEAALAAVARLSIPELADWCIVDVLEDGAPRRMEVAHRDPARAPLAAALRAFPLDHAARQRLPSARALQSRRPILVPEYTDEMLRQETDGEYLDLARQLRVCSVLTVPVHVSSSLATVTFIMTAESGRRHGAEDVAVAEELVNRAAQVVENARVHQKLRQTEERFRVALAHSRVTLFEQDVHGRYRWIYNPPLGYRPEEVLGKSNEEIVPHDDAVLLDALDDAVFRGGERVHEEVRITPPSGEPRYLLVSQEPLRDRTGSIVGLTGAATDITEQKQAQEQLAQAVAFREQMMGILGHDLRNPLAAVRSLASLLLRRGDLPQGARDCVAEIDRAGYRMLEMIGTLLDFTRTRFTGELPIAPVSADLHDVCRRVIDEVAAAQPERVVELEVAGDGRGTWDPARLAQVVSNLVSNALQHGARDVPVRVSVGGDADEAFVHVENQGPPIPRELLAVIFEPFCRGSREASHAPGLGLGLFIARQIVTAHGGALAVESTAERGTRFTVRLPRCAARESATRAAEPWAAAGPGAAAQA